MPNRLGIYRCSPDKVKPFDEDIHVDSHAVPAQSAREDGDAFFSPWKFQPEREVSPIAAKVLLKILYAARLCGFGLLRAICHPAAFVTK